MNLKKLISLLLAITVIISCSSVYALASENSASSDTPKTTSPTTDSYQASDYDLTYVPHDKHSATTYGTWNINWSIPKGKTSRGSNQFSVTSSLSFEIDIAWTPSDAEITYGLYDTVNKQYAWAGTESSGSTAGTMTISTPGTYSFAIRNDSTGAVTVTGSYTV